MITTGTQRSSYVGTGTTGPFAFNFRIFAAADLQVIRRDPATTAETVYAYGTDYALTAGVNIGDATGSITLTVALAAGQILSIRRIRPPLQTTSLRNQSAYFAATVEDALDSLSMAILEVNDDTARVPRLKDSFDPATMSMSLIPETGKVIGWLTPNAIGNIALSSGAVGLPGEGRTVATLTAYLLNNRVYNVYDFGAIGNGVVDDTAAFNLALSKIAAVNGGILWCPQGTFKLTSTLDIPDGTTIMGVGKSSAVGSPTTRLSFATLTGATPAILLSDASDVCLRDFYLTGRTAGAGDEISTTGNNRRIRIQDLIVNSATTGNGIGFSVTGYTIQSSITGVDVVGAGNGIFVGASCTSILIAHCYMNACTVSGYYIRGTYIELSACASDGASVTLFPYLIDAAKSVTIVGCGAELNVRSAVWIQGAADGVTIVGMRGVSNNTGASASVPSAVNIEGNADHVTCIGFIDTTPNAATTVSVGSFNGSPGSNIYFVNCVLPKGFSPATKNSPPIGAQAIAGIASANDLFLGIDPTVDYFQITGAVQINRLDAGLWRGGRVVTLKFNGAPTVKHNQAGAGTLRPIILNAAVDLVAAASNLLTLRFDSVDNVWYEQSRKV